MSRSVEQRESAWATTRLLQATQAPLNNAIPYLYFTINPLDTSTTNLVSVIFDPADPALYVDGKTLAAIPLGPVSVSGIGFSSQGLIPYTPVDAPSQYTGQMSSGDLVLQGSVDTTGITMIPSKVNGSITLNLDPNHTGKILGGVDVSAADLTGIFGSSFATVLGSSSSLVAQNLGQIFRNLSVGINGTLSINPLASFQQDLSWQIGNEILGLPTGPSSFLDQVLNWSNDKLGNPQTLALLSIGDGSLIYNGPTEGLYFRGGTTNPFAGTPLAALYSIATQAGVAPTLNLDAAVLPGDEFFLNVSGTSNVVGLPESGEVVIARDYPVSGPATKYLSASSSANSTGLSKLRAPTLYTGIYLDANVNVLAGSVSFQGDMPGNGDFTIQATAQIDLGAMYRLGLLHAERYSRPGLFVHRQPGRRLQQRIPPRQCGCGLHLRHRRWHHHIRRQRRGFGTGLPLLSYRLGGGQCVRRHLQRRDLGFRGRL